jgi:hypothetical protein
MGCFIALTMGQQSWIRLLNIDHSQVMAETTASLVRASTVDSNDERDAIVL